MVPDRAWPEQVPAGAVRFARGTRHLEACRRFYGSLIGLPLIFEFEADNEDGLRGLIFGVPDSTLTLEIIEAVTDVPVDSHDQFVLYLEGTAGRDSVARRLREEGLEPTTQYSYWEQRGAVSFRDPDGRAVVLAPWVFGVDPVPTPSLGDSGDRPPGSSS